MRIAGYRYALDESGDQTDSPIVLIGDPNSVEFVNKIRQIGPTAIVCSNDTTAFYLLRSLQAAGVRVPEDIKLVGVDDVKIASEASVPFTTIRQPCREMGVVAVRTMTRRIENRKMVACTYCLDVELVVRESCGFKLKSIQQSVTFKSLSFSKSVTSKRQVTDSLLDQTVQTNQYRNSNAATKPEKSKTVRAIEIEATRLHS
jgi:ABC-type sugar transport system substrate-binding protein